MTHTEKLEAVRRKCIEANPEKRWFSSQDEFHSADWDKKCDFQLGDMPCCEDTYPSLADVLLAIGAGQKQEYFINARGEFAEDMSYESPMHLRKFWNLRADDLSQQSEETVSFIHSLLA